MYSNLTMLEAGVYIHIPFCNAKCYYCDFLSFSDMEEIYSAYVNELLNDIRYSVIGKVTSVYIGGGTPTVLPLILMEDVLSCLSDLPLVVGAEVSIEVNPGTVTKDYLKLIKSSGVNRLSFGLQTTCDRLLSIIGRVHTYEQFLKNYLAAREVGFDNINVDMIFGLPGQTQESFEASLLKILCLKPQHISFYSLTPCENTPLWNDMTENNISLPDDEADRNMYHFALKVLSGQGYRHYEISNSAKPGYECSHNIDCWLQKPYIGFGLGAHSFDGQRRWTNPSSFTDYFSKAKPEIDLLSDNELMSEAMILGLRLTDGVDEVIFESRYGIKPSTFFESQISKLVSDGLLLCADNRIRLTSQGLDLANRVFVMFLQGA